MSGFKAGDRVRLSPAVCVPEWEGRAGRIEFPLDDDGFPGWFFVYLDENAYCCFASAELERVES